MRASTPRDARTPLAAGFRVARVLARGEHVVARGSGDMSPPRGHASVPCLVFGVLALMTGAAALAGRLARERRELPPPRRALRQIALERDAEAYDFFELAPGTSGPAPTHWLLRDALEEIPAEAARAFEVRAATFADAARRLVGAHTPARASSVPIAPAREWAAWAATLPEASSES